MLVKTVTILNVQLVVLLQIIVNYLAIMIVSNVIHLDYV